MDLGVRRETERRQDKGGGGPSATKGLSKFTGGGEGREGKREG